MQIDVYKIDLIYIILHEKIHNNSLTFRSRIDCP